MIDKYEKPFNEAYYNELKKLDVKQAVRYKNPYVYLSSKQRNEAKETAEGLIKRDQETLELFRKNGSVWPLIEHETNFQVTWKTKLRDLRLHHRVLNRCPIGGLELVLANSAATYSHVQWVVASHQPEVNGMNGPRDLEHWEDHAFHFNEQYHPQCFDSFWRKDIPEGHFIDEYGIVDIAKEKIANGIEHELYDRKFYYYLNFWEMWGFRFDEFGLCCEGEAERNFCSYHVKKAESFIEKCLKEGKRQPFPYYDKSKDEYWKYRTPNSWELVLADRLADAKREREEYYLKHMR